MENKIDRASLVRKGFHLTSPLWLVWYWVPPDAGLGVRKEGVLVAILSLALLIEALRLIRGRPFIGLRPYEADRLSAYAWGSLGLAAGLLFFPGEFVIPTFWGMAWIDPLCASTRKRGGYPWIPFAAYIALATTLFLAVVPMAPYGTRPVTPILVALYAPLAAAVAIVVEKPNLAQIDDDFLMHVIPLVALTGAATALAIV